MPAGGVGLRAGTGYPKQYRAMLGAPMLRWAVRALLADSRISEVRVAVAADDCRVAEALRGLPRTIWRPCGGETRAATVLGALRDATPDPDSWVLVHDAARPGLPSDALGRLIDACLHSGEGGLLAERVADTVKREQTNLVAGQIARVAASVDREGLWLAQTPQMFRAGVLQAALEAAGGIPTVTDEASAMERAGYQPLLIPGSIRNFKVTWPEHFELMEQLLKPGSDPGFGVGEAES